MKVVLLIIIQCLVFIGWTQDTLMQQDFENIEIQVESKSSIIFEDSKRFIIDFYVGDQGSFLLLKNRSNYFACSLDEDFSLKHSIKLNFKPKKLFADCLGFLHVLGRDSLYQLEKINDELVIYEVNSLDLYHSFLEKCIASNSSQIIFRHSANFNQTTIFYGISKTDNKQTPLYLIEDAMLVSSTEEKYDSLVLFDPGETALVGDIFYDLDQTKYYDGLHNYNQDLNFFNQIVTLPAYYPVFVNRDTTFVFDYLNRVVVAMNDTGRIHKIHPISYAENRDIQFDERRGQFYSITHKNGAQVYGLLSPDNFEVIRSTPIEKHAFPKKAMIYNGSIYYLEKEFKDDNLNKLFRQRIKF